MSVVNNILINLAGEDQSIFDQQSPISKKKILSQATLLLIAPFIWFAMGFCISRNYFDSGLISAIFSGLISGLVVFVVERSILMSQANRGLTIFRFLLAVIMSLLGGELINLELFRDDIQIVKTSELLDYSTKQVEKYENIYMQKQNDFEQEMNGSGSDKGVGYGQIAKKKEKIMIEAKNQWIEIKEKMENLDYRLKTNQIIYKKGLLYDSKLLLNMVFSDIHVMVLFLFWCFVILFFEMIVVLNKIYSPKSSFEIKQLAFENLSKLEVQKLEQKVNQYLNTTDEQLQLRQMVNKDINTL